MNWSFPSFDPSWKIASSRPDFRLPSSSSARNAACPKLPAWWILLKKKGWTLSWGPAGARPSIPRASLPSSSSFPYSPFPPARPPVRRPPPRP
ncbi:MAG: hypothetical protein AMJ94_16215 [Deltaproteobacteria bacterium SM23_61]|nr:MAG: hypothetical protein AMJ94_16215 [Deltaproteobacteria bacterium SM23_61]